jgi:hypothetical protein
VASSGTLQNCQGEIGRTAAARLIPWIAGPELIPGPASAPGIQRDSILFLGSFPKMARSRRPFELFPRLAGKPSSGRTLPAYKRAACGPVGQLRTFSRATCQIRDRP